MVTASIPLTDSGEEWEWTSIDTDDGFVSSNEWTSFGRWNFPATMATIHNRDGNWRVVHEDERLILAVSPREVRILIFRRLKKD
jgi:hypothetical protein